MKKWFLTVAVLLIVIGGTVSFGLWQWLTSAFDAEGPLVANRVVVIPKGLGTRAIARKLADEGVIQEPLVFLAGVRLAETGTRLKAGEYEFPARVSTRQAMEILMKGETAAHWLTIPEGLTSKQIVRLINAADSLQGTIDVIPDEGTLLPETYHYSLDEDRNVLVLRMSRAMTECLDALWEGRQENLPLQSRAEAVVLASIVERETALASERPHVAAVFINRLRRGMKLQSDPTTIYGLSDGMGVLNRPLTRKDLASTHAYNTYAIDGLPPGPIANPGRESLAAVLNPIKSDDLYFVADGSGGHVFARTLAEHNRNVARWRQIEKGEKP